MLDGDWSSDVCSSDLDRNNNRPILTSAIHLYHDNTLKGTIGVDISTDSISGFTEPFFNGRGLSVLCTKTGQIISSSEENSLSDRNPVALNLSDLLPESEKERVKDLLTGTTQDFTYENGYFSLGKDLDSAPFRLITLISTKDFIISMIPNMYVYIFSILTAIAMFVLGTFIIITRFIKPTRIAEIALTKAHDELEIRVKERTTELIRMNSELKESREKYRQLFIHAPAGIYEIDFISGKFVSVNDVLCEYTGYSKDEFLNLSPFALLTPQGKEILKERLNTVLKIGRAHV
jgi:PAS domain-containing protein